MRRQIAFLGAAILICYTALFVKFNQLQVVQAGSLNDRPENSRSLQRDFNEPRGSIVTAEASAIRLADAVASVPPVTVVAPV